MIRFARNDDLEKLRPIWKDCFLVDFYSPYGIFYIWFVFQKYKPLLYIENEKPVSMLTLYPIKMISNNKVYKGLYIWAVGTLKEYRQQNIATKMLSYVSEYSGQNGIDFNLIVPQGGSETLYNFYQKRGFNIDLKHKVLLLTKNQMRSFCEEETESLEFKNEVDSKNLKEMRERNFKNLDFISWGPDELDVIQKEYSLPGGNHFVLDFGEGQYVILDLRDSLKMVIREVFVSRENLKKFINTLLSHYKDYEFFEFSLPTAKLPTAKLLASELSDEENLKSLDFSFKNVAMLKLINPEIISPEKSEIDKDNLYFNFALDT